LDVSLVDLAGRRDTQIPVTVITGFLGAGKTTLLQRILNEGTNRNYAVIVNEYGDIGIDGDLIDTGEEELIELSSGCICCVVRGDLIRSIRSLLSERPNLEGIIIETTGLANPSPVIQTMTVDQIIGTQCKLDSVICVVDAIHILQQLSESRDAADQIAFSDNIILNKVAETQAGLSEIQEALRNINPIAPITETNRSNVSPKKLLSTNSFELSRIETQVARASDRGMHNHIEDTGITSVSLTCKTPLNEQKIESWLENLLNRRGADVLRTKGILSIAGNQQKLAIQSVNMMLEGAFIGKWKKDDRISRIIMIGRKLDAKELDNGFQSCQQCNEA